ncbi:hypothetical protein NQ315_009225 [Exocentrus adspersus]|uniref:Uncharacterized protein n=1 Tax=Exocentrus adspersus TaxID=1586481 RepID=A0AAV8WG34_9CUCU|nr:hypothetical protein NQ315_009225 [Exocentrus adspersus]
MIVFVPERSLEVFRSGYNGNRVNFTCLASEVYPAPKIMMYKENKDEFYRARVPSVQLDISKHPNGRFTVFIVSSVLAEILHPGALVHCELRIPGTGYVKIKSLLYYPQSK